MNISGYRIEKQIGKGGMAMVYLAIQESLGRPVALKVMSPVFSDTEEFSERFLNEGRMLASLSHSNIITIHDIGISDALYFISMEYVEGGDLSDKIKQGITPETAIEYTRAIAGSLQIAHIAHIVHRDIKPANILFRKDGTLLLTDFGIAKQLVSTKDLTAAGSILGTPYYLSPEQALGETVDGRADIYSLGIMLYEMLLGTRPYEGKSDVDTALKHITEDLPTLPDQFAVYQNLLEAMTARKLDDRFPSMGSLLEALSEIQSTGKWSGNIAQFQDVTTPPVSDNTDVNESLFAGGSEAETMVGPGDTVGLSAESANTIEATATNATVPMAELPTQLINKPAKKFPWLSVGVAGIFFIALVIGTAVLYIPAQREEVSKPVPQDQPPAKVLQDELEVERQRYIQQQVKSLLQKAETALGKYYLTRPEHDNAYDYYQKVLELDPENSDAQDGFTRIADKYYVLAKDVEKSWDYDKAIKYVKQGLKVKPDHRKLLRMQGELKKSADDVSTKTKKAFSGIKKLFD